MLGDLIAVFGTLSVGLFSLLCLASFVWIVKPRAAPNAEADTGPTRFFGWFVHRLTSAMVNRTNVAVGVPLVLLGLYGASLIVEDLTDHLVDSAREEKRFFVFELQRSLLGSEQGHRFRTVFSGPQLRKAGDPTSGYCFKLNGLGTELAKNGRLTASLSLQTRGRFDGTIAKLLTSGRELAVPDTRDIDTVLALKRTVEQPGDELATADQLAVQDAAAVINVIYYRCKNWAYGQATYFSELSNLQKRIDFTRSLFLVASFSLLIHALFAAVGFVIGAAYNRVRPRWVVTAPFSTALRAGSFAIALFAVSFVSCFGYRLSENKFNERAFGYYSSALHHEASGEPGMVDVSELDANLWAQESGEYRALCRQAYAIATQRLVDAVAQKKSGAQLAVVLDLDETVLSNAPYEAWLTKNGLTYPSGFEAWCASGLDVAVPGALAFCQKAAGEGVRVFYVSDRDASLAKLTHQRLTGLGFPCTTDTLLLQANAATKARRREEISKGHQIILNIGDSLSDFDLTFEAAADNKSCREAVVTHQARFGADWIVLPNPMYGAWERRVGTTSTLKVAALSPWSYHAR